MTVTKGKSIEGVLWALFSFLVFGVFLRHEMRSTSESLKSATVTNSNVYLFTGAINPTILNSMVTLFLLQLLLSHKTKLKSHIQSYLRSFSCIRKAI